MDEFIRKVSIIVAIAAFGIIMLWALWNLAEPILIIFLGLLFAIFLRALAKQLNRHLKIPIGWAVAAALVLVLALSATLLIIAVPRFLEQIHGESLQTLSANISSSLNSYSWGRLIVAQASKLPASVFGSLESIFTLTTTFIIDAVVVFFIGVYAAFNPEVWVGGVLLFVPPRHQRRAARIIAYVGSQLELWLFGRLIMMLVVGVLTTVGLIIIGVPLAYLLGIIAGLLTFIEYVGPIVSAVPAIIVALATSPKLALWAVMLYLLVHLIEGYLLSPFIVQRTVELDAASIIVAEFLFGVLFGTIGLIVAIPLWLVIVLLIRALYLKRGTPIEEL
jgi:predicted PurR-regulated permease PerM